MFEFDAYNAASWVALWVGVGAAIINFLAVYKTSETSKAVANQNAETAKEVARMTGEFNRSLKKFEHRLALLKEAEARKVAAHDVMLALVGQMVIFNPFSEYAKDQEHALASKKTFDAYSLKLFEQRAHQHWFSEAAKAAYLTHLKAVHAMQNAYFPSWDTTYDLMYKTDILKRMIFSDMKLSADALHEQVARDLWNPHEMEMKATEE